MKNLRIVLVLALLGIMALSYSCKKDAEHVINCLFEHFSIDHTIDAQDPKTVTFTVSYDGEHTLENSIVWNFGDGHTETISGTTAVHTYSASGTYEATARVTVTEGDSYCTHNPTESVTVN